MNEITVIDGVAVAQLPKLIVAQKRDYSLLITVKESDRGAAVDISGNTFKSEMRLSTEDTSPVTLTVVDTDLSNGQVTVIITKAQTTAVTDNFTRLLEVVRKESGGLVKDVHNAYLEFVERGTDFV